MRAARGAIEAGLPPCLSRGDDTVLDGLENLMGLTKYFCYEPQSSALRPVQSGCWVLMGAPVAVLSRALNVYVNGDRMPKAAVSQWPFVALRGPRAVSVQKIPGLTPTLQKNGNTPGSNTTTCRLPQIPHPKSIPPNPAQYLGISLVLLLSIRAFS